MESHKYPLSVHSTSIVASRYAQQCWNDSLLRRLEYRELILVELLREKYNKMLRAGLVTCYPDLSIYRPSITFYRDIWRALFMRLQLTLMVISSLEYLLMLHVCLKYLHICICTLIASSTLSRMYLCRFRQFWILIVNITHHKGDVNKHSFHASFVVCALTRHLLEYIPIH